MDLDKALLKSLLFPNLFPPQSLINIRLTKGVNDIRCFCFRSSMDPNNPQSTVSVEHLLLKLRMMRISCCCCRWVSRINFCLSKLNQTCCSSQRWREAGATEHEWKPSSYPIGSHSTFSAAVYNWKSRDLSSTRKVTKKLLSGKLLRFTTDYNLHRSYGNDNITTVTSCERLQMQM